MFAAVLLNGEVMRLMRCGDDAEVNEERRLVRAAERKKKEAICLGGWKLLEGAATLELVCLVGKGPSSQHANATKVGREGQSLPTGT